MREKGAQAVTISRPSGKKIAIGRCSATASVRIAAEALLVGGDEGDSLGIAIRIELGFDQSLVCDFSGSGEFAAL